MAEPKPFGSAGTATVLRYGADPLQVGDLRLPDGRGPFPVAVLIHGGCWLSGADARSAMNSFAEGLTRRGFATWNVEYRGENNPGGGWPGTFQDVAAAVDAVAGLAKRYPLDTGRVTVVGHSAGAHLALWAASRPRLPAPWSRARIRPVSAVAIDGPGGLASFIGADAAACGHPVVVPLMGGTPAQKPAEYRIASPSDNLPLGLHQLAIGADLKDALRAYVAAARGSGDVVDLLEPPGAHHFDVIDGTAASGRAALDFIAAKALIPAQSPPRGHAGPSGSGPS